jgi:hypothetical protein
MSSFRDLLKKEFAEQVPLDSQKQALAVVNSLTQEYRYLFVDRIVRQKLLTLPKLYLMEDMERAMLALHAEKLRARLQVIVPYKAPDKKVLPYDPEIEITRCSKYCGLC